MRHIDLIETRRAIPGCENITPRHGWLEKDGSQLAIELCWYGLFCEEIFTL